MTAKKLSICVPLMISTLSSKYLLYFIERPVFRTFGFTRSLVLSGDSFISVHVVARIAVMCMDKHKRGASWEFAGILLMDSVPKADSGGGALPAGAFGCRGSSLWTEAESSVLEFNPWIPVK